MSKVIVVEYDPEWPKQFERLRSVLWETLSKCATSIEHVGSTAVPGLASKPVLDIDVVVPRTEVGRAIERLRGIGYCHRGNLGIPDREAFRSPAGSIRHHLYVCPEGSPALANHLTVREDLRENPAAARAYGVLKRQLAVEFVDDIDGYMEGKSGFLIDLLRRSGFPEERLAEIEAFNRRPESDLKGS